jgi:Zn-dependent protease with chaperone function
MSELTSDCTTAEWTDGRVAAVTSVVLQIHGDSLFVLSLDRSTQVAKWSIGSLRMDSMLDGEVTYIESTDLPSCTAATRDPSFVRVLRARGAKLKAVPVRLRGVIALCCAAGVVSVFASLYLAMPFISRAIATRIPMGVEQRLNPQMSALFNPETCRTPQSSAALTVLRHRLDPRGSIPVQIRIVNIEAPNAFALPGGGVLLTRGLVEQAQSGEEIAGVLAHELAHVKHRHVLAELIQDTFMSALWAVTFGDYSGLLVVDPRTAEHLISLRHSREVEAEADRTGLAILADAKVSATGLASFLERNQVAAIEGGLSFLSSHPQTADRLRMVHEVPPVEGAPVLTEEELDALHEACNGMQPIESLKQLFR